MFIVKNSVILQMGGKNKLPKAALIAKTTPVEGLGQYVEQGKKKKYQHK